MKLLIHTPFFHPQIGGVETFADGLAEELHRNGIGVTLLAETPLGENVELERGYRLLRANPQTRKRAIADADAILSVGPATRMLPAARRRGLPMVLVHQNPMADCPIGIGWRHSELCSYRFLKCLRCDVSGQSTRANIKGIVRFKILRWAMRRAVANVYISETIALRTGMPGERIGNFFDPAIFHRDANVEPEPVFLFVGRLVPIKGADVAIRAFAAARKRGLNFRLRVVGRGPEEANLRRLAEAEGVSEFVEFAGPKSGTALAAEYRKAYATLFPSQWAEPFGIVMIESLACGCPVIASDRGACAEVLDDAGIIVAAEDVEAWAQAMIDLAADPERREPLSRRAVARAEFFSLPEIGRRYMELLERVVANV